MRNAGLTMLVLLLASACSGAGRSAAAAPQDGNTDASYATSLHDPGAGSFLYGPRTHHTATLLSDGRVLVAGGIHGERLIAECEIYDPATGAFLPTAPLGTPRIGHVTVMLPSGQVVLASGFDGTRLLDSIEVFVPGPRFASDTTDASWQLAPLNLRFPRSQARAIALPGTNASAMLLVGGFTGAGTEFAATNGSELLILDGDGNGDWSDARVELSAQPRFARTGHSLTLLPGPDAMLGSADDWVLAYGGLGADPFESSNGASSLVVLGEPEVYRPWEDSWHSGAANRWYPASPQFDPESQPAGFVGPRKDHRAVLLTDGRVLFVGGSNGLGTTAGNSLVQRAEIYVPDYSDPKAGRFLPSAVLDSPRQGLSATAIPNGRAMIAGGYDGSTERLASTVEVYVPGEQPSSDRFDAMGVLHVGRVYHTATLLAAPTDRIVLLGGITSSREPTFLAEIYRVERAVAVTR